MLKSHKWMVGWMDGRPYSKSTGGANNDASIEKASIGTDDDGEFCEAEGNAEKKENIPDVEACKVRVNQNDDGE